MITIPSPAYFDNSEPPLDDRTHEQIEQDAQEHARWVAGLNYKAPERDPRWDAVDAKRKSSVAAAKTKCAY